MNPVANRSQALATDQIKHNNENSADENVCAIFVPDFGNSKYI